MVLFIDVRRLFWSKLLMNITNFHLRPFELMIDHFEVSQKQNDVWNRNKLRWKFAKKDFKASRGFVYLFKMINLVKDIEGYHKLIFETPFIILWVP